MNKEFQRKMVGPGLFLLIGLIFIQIIIFISINEERKWMKSFLNDLKSEHTQGDSGDSL